MLSGERSVSHTAAIVLAAMVLLAASASSLRAQERTGWFNITWVDPPRGQRPPAPVYGLSDAQGRWTRLAVDDAALRAAGGARALEGKRVSVLGDVTTAMAPAPGITAQTSILRVRSLRSLDPVAAGPSASMSASSGTEVKPYVMLLCSFPDNQYDMYPKSRYESFLGPTRPNVGHYYNEASFGRLSLAGSAVFGWFTLPNPFLYYYPNGGGSLRLTEFLNDCVAAADASVDFTQYAGIIVQHNAGTGWAYGGKRVLALDGQTRTYGVAWIPRSGPATLAHEIGHTIGFLHSSGGYGLVYDSWWDVMSNANIYTDYSLNPPDYVPQHTIAYNKWWAGWIDLQRVLVPELPSTQSVMLLYGDRAPTTAGYQLVRALGPLGSGTAQLAEARRRIGYDQALPGDAVVLHSYDVNRSEPAQVIDVDRNGNPNDSSAMWTVGESYADSVFGVTVDVDSVNASGYGVTVVRGWRLRMQATGPGSISGAPTGACTSRCDHIAAARGTTITLSAQPAAGAQFLAWSGSCGGTGACTVKLDGNRAVGATFAVSVTVISESERPRAIVGRPYADKLVATGGSASITWAVRSGALPPGLALSSNTGVLSGEPTKEGRYEFTLTAASGPLSTERSFVIDVVRPLVIVTNASLPRAVVGTPFTTTLAADGGVGAVRWSVSSGAVPAGVALESATGKLAGTPTAAGAFEFTVVAVSDTLRDTRKFSLGVTAPVVITSATERRGAVMGASYADTVRATGGNGTFDWRLASGDLPAGVALEPSGVVRGTPAAGGSFRFTISATSEDLTAQREFTLVVTKPTLAANSVLDALLAGSSTLTADERNFLDLLGNHNGRVDLGDVRAWLVDIKALQADAGPGESMAALTRLGETQSSVGSSKAPRSPPTTNARGARP